MKPWEEEWTGDRGIVLGKKINSGLHKFGAQFGGPETTPEEDYARAQLAAAAPELVRALLAVEYDRTDDEGLGFCADCGWKEGDGHDVRCLLNNALVRAGVRKGAE